ncbi:MAG: hypothetical protein AB1762_04525, partial [Gemmatimonadota bacterium]
GDHAAIQRLLRAVPNATDPSLGDAQFTIAREYGFDNWTKLVHHIEAILAADRLPHFDQLVGAFVDAWNGGADGLQHLSELHGRPISPDEVREHVKRGFGSDTLAIDDARKHVARLYGFDSWERLVESLAEQPEDARQAPFGMSSTPPFYKIDWSESKIEPRGPIAEKDWETLFAVMREHGLTKLEGNAQLTDAALSRLASAHQVTHLNLEGHRLTDKGLRHLAQMPQLRELTIGGWHSPITDRGLEVLRHLPNLERFQSCWTRHITDAGVANLTFCDKLIDVDLLGTPTGDGSINALTGKRYLLRLKTGRQVTDAGLALLTRFPSFVVPQPGEAKYGMMEFLAGPVSLLIDGPFTAKGLTSLTPLTGLNGLSFFWHTSLLSGDSLAPLAEMTNLAMLGCQDALCNDAAMRHIAAIPNLRMLMAQGTVATDAGFTALSRSQTLEFIWGRDANNLASDGFVALSRMPALKGIALSCKNVHDSALAALSNFPALTALVPMDVRDEGFRYVAVCTQLENLWCMYCRDTGDVATEFVAQLPHLKQYYAGATKITDKSLHMLAHMATLENVELWEIAGISNAGVSALAALPGLREIAISGSPNVTRDVLAAFPPNVRVTYS